MTFIMDPPTLRVMMNGFDLMVRTTIDVKRTVNNWTYTMLFFGSSLSKVHKLNAFCDNFS